jgi:hypothetical protein
MAIDGHEMVIVGGDPIRTAPLGIIQPGEVLLKQGATTHLCRHTGSASRFSTELSI